MATTFALIRNQIISVVEGLTPALMNRPEDKFRRCPDKTMLVQAWALAHAADNCFRRFDLRTSGPISDPQILADPYQRNQQAHITVAYPVAPAMYGANDLDSMEDVIASDAAQIRDAVFSPGNLIPSHIANIVTIEDLDRTEETVWFQKFALEVIYYHSQTLT